MQDVRPRNTAADAALGLAMTVRDGVLMIAAGLLTGAAVAAVLPMLGSEGAL